jgi:radical SAM/Cys-rich protein
LASFACLMMIGISSSFHQPSPITRRRSAMILFQSSSVRDVDPSTATIDWRRKDLFGTSLLEQTLKEMETTSPMTDTSLTKKDERAARRRALDSLGIPSFAKYLQENHHVTSGLKRKSTVSVLQLNIGLYCNQACSHCHVESSPRLVDKMMAATTAARCLALIDENVQTLDITGGAPELNEQFRYLVAMARAKWPHLEIIDRCNLTVLSEPGQEDLIDFLKEHKVRIVASLPCYSAGNVDKQRGKGVFERSIAGLLALNEAGYGTADLTLDLVYNPSGAFLPPSQSNLEKAYKKELEETYGIVFNRLLTITNMPIKRFADYLHRNKQMADYMELLVNSFNKDTLESVMCRDTISIGYDGSIYDCDFNQQLGMTKKKKTVFDVDSLDELVEDPILVDNHCFGCTAGMGSS